MPQQIPQIPKVDNKTSYQGLKGIVAKLRDEFLSSYLVDSDSVTIVDNPGNTRSAEVNAPGFAAPSVTLDLSAISIGATLSYEYQVATEWPARTPVAIDSGQNGADLVVRRSYVDSANLVIWFENTNSVGTFTFADDITVRAIF